MGLGGKVDQKSRRTHKIGPFAKLAESYEPAPPHSLIEVAGWTHGRLVSRNHADSTSTARLADQLGIQPTTWNIQRLCARRHHTVVRLIPYARISSVLPKRRSLTYFECHFMKRSVVSASRVNGITTRSAKRNSFRSKAKRFVLDDPTSRVRRSSRLRSSRVTCSGKPRGTSLSPPRDTFKRLGPPTQKVDEHHL